MTEQNKAKSKPISLFPRWYTIWFLLACIVLLCGGIIDELNGKISDGFNAWGASISIFLMYIIVLLVWLKREPLQAIFLRIRIPILIKAILIGWVFAEIDELVCFPFNSLFPEATLTQDIVLTTPMYIFAHLFWFWVLHKYKFSIRESFYIGGSSLWIIEVVFGGGGAMIILGVLLWPFMIMIHGCHMVLPRLILTSYFTQLEQKDTRWKYVLGIVAPLIGTGIGIIVACIIGPLFFDL
ncbi:MAG: hypothetical protein HQL32_02485 [Planctomycetes bacterium]|nr:hypothetical protein [Planctomycetota bacterium]